MPATHRLPFAVATFIAAIPAADAQTPGSPPPAGTISAALLLGAITTVAAAVAIFLAFRAQRLAEHATLEAGEARARASQTGGGGVTPEALAAAERVWSARIAALEAQIASGGPRPAAGRPPTPPSAELAARVEEVERIVAGLNASVKELRRPVPPAAAPAPREHTEIPWTSTLAADTPAMNEVRQTLAQALKSREPAARDLLDRLRAVEHWPAKKPAAAEVATALTEISSLLLAALRRGATVAPLDGSLLSDRVLAALRLSWKTFRPELDCRSFYPGATFDPDWMEDHTPAGLQRPVISEMLSWAVFEKLDSGRRMLAKARVTSE